MFKPLTIATALAVLALAACTPPAPPSAADLTARCVEVVTTAAAAAADDAADAIEAGIRIDPADVRYLADQIRDLGDVCGGVR